MTFIENSSPLDWSVNTLFFEPYKEGVRNLTLGFSCCCPDLEGESEALSLLEKITHVILGVLLLIPIINTLLYLALHEVESLQPLRPPYETVETMSYPDALDERAMTLQTLDTKRQELIQEKNLFPENDPRREGLKKQIKQVEFDAAQILIKKYAPSIDRHVQMSSTRHPDLIALEDRLKSQANTSKVVKGIDEQAPEVVFEKVAGLSQYEGANNLCGYYALFFMLQAITEGDFVDRDAFHPLFEKWYNMIALLRTSDWLNTHPELPIPYGLDMSVMGPSSRDLQFLIDESPELAPVREHAGCFLFEMDSYRDVLYSNDPVRTCTDPLHLLGKCKTTQTLPQGFPMFCILKNIDSHYYLVYAKEPGKFSVVNSLNWDISSQSLSEFVAAISGKQTDLRIEW